MTIETIEFTPFWFERLVDLVMILIVFTIGLLSVPFMVYWERKLMARVQHRVGPNRVGPFGLLQTIVDGIKLLLKEDIVPEGADRALHTIAPLINIIPAIVLLAILPFGPVIEFQPADFSFTLAGVSVVFPTYAGGFQLPLGVADTNLGILFYMAITGVAVYGIVLAGWSSNSKYSLLGGIRSTAQMISYELALGLSILGLLLITGTLDLRTIIGQQSGGFWTWHIVSQPVGFLLFMTAGFAETNRLPFDLPEGESELGGGFHTEYSSMKFAMFFMAEYMNMLIFSTILITLFLGGFHAPIPALMIFEPGTIGYGLMGVFWMGLKIFLMISFMIFIRSTWPRFRYDQLMNLGWKLMLPVALINLVGTAAVFAFFGGSMADHAVRLPLPLTVIGCLFIFGMIELFLVDAWMNRYKKRLLAS